MSRVKLVIFLLMAVTLAASGLYWRQLLVSQEELRNDALEETQLRGRQLADAVAQQTEALITAIDFTTRQLAKAQADNPKRIPETVEAALESFPANAITQIAVIDAEGYLAYSSLGTPQKLYLGDREHFTAHLAPTSNQLFVSKPMLGRVSQTWSIQFSRAVRSQDRFLGVVVVSISPEYIGRQLAALHLNDKDMISLFRQDGSYLARSSNLREAMGKSTPADRPFLGANAPNEGTLRVVAAFDQVPRTYAWKRVDNRPMVVVIGLAEATVLDPLESSFASSRLRNGLGLGFVLLLTFSIAWLLQQLGDQHRQLLESSKRYHGVFDSNTAIKLIIDPVDGRIVDANPAAVVFYGYPRDRLLAMNVNQIICLSPEALQAEIALAEKEHRAYHHLTHRLASGTLRQVEVYSGPLQDGKRTLQFSIIHDVTNRRELELQLLESEERHRALLQTMAEGVMMVDSDGRIVDWNDAALAILGVDAQGLVERQVVLRQQDGTPLAREYYPSARAARGEVFDHAQFQIERSDGKPAWVAVSSRPLFRQGEMQPYGAVVSYSDVTAVHEAEESLRLADSVFQGASEAIVVADAERRILAVNPAFALLTGYTSEEVLGNTPDFLIPADQRESLLQQSRDDLERKNLWQVEIDHVRKDGTVFVAALKISALKDSNGKPYRYVALFADITNRKRREQAVWRQANFDPLTGLANRKLFDDRLLKGLAQARRKHTELGLLFIDLDGFKGVNDVFGHAAGDELLRQVAQRLGISLREEDTIARMGGDEFVALLSELRGLDAAEKAAQKIVTVLSQPYKVGENFVEISCSIGIASYPRDAANATTLLQCADSAMYQAKLAGKNTWRHWEAAREIPKV